MPVTFKYQAAAGSDPGLQRGNNEDRFHCDAERGIYLVVDGMGGQAAGEMAAEIAVSMLRARLERQTGSPAERIREAIAIANNEVYRLSQSNLAWHGMACVLTVALVEDGRATIGHVGDSRLYLLGPGGIRKVTRDHSPVGEREERQEFSEREAMQHPRRNEVYRDVGSSEHGPDDAGFIDITEIEFPPDHAILLCSDGLSDLLTSSEIRGISERNAGDPWSVTQSLIEAANQAGGKDNITVVVVEGSDYASSMKSHSQSTPSIETLSDSPWLTNRWAFLVYGVVLGCLIAIAAAPWIWRAGQTASGSAISAPRTWTVGPAESADAGTIGAALTNARAGDTVVVAPGEYIEAVQLKDGVNVVSQDLHGAIVRANQQGLAVLADGVKSGRIAGFRIEGDASHPLTVGLDLKDSSVEAQDLLITGARGAGIEIRGNSSAIVRANQILRNPGTGIIIRDTAAPRIAHNTIAGNGKGDRLLKPGVDIRDAARPLLFGNTIAGNASEGVWVNQGVDAATIAARNFFSMPGTPGRRAVRVIPR